MSAKTNLVLIGMPGSGKSTVGVILAKSTSHDFIDTDVLIQSQQQQSLQNIMDTQGYLALREIEEQALLGLNLDNHIISTGGSAVYSEAAMHHLKQSSLIVFLNVSQSTLNKRISNYETRGIAKRPEQSFAELFQERSLLYKRYADITIHSDEMTQDEVCEAILKHLPASA